MERCNVPRPHYPRMTEELKEIGLDVGHRRVGRLMRQNGISVVRTRKHKVTTDSDHKFNIAPIHSKTLTHLDTRLVGFLVYGKTEQTISPSVGGSVQVG